MKKQYSYKIGGFQVETREAARMIQRSLPKLDNGYAPQITQRLVMDRVVR